VSCTRGLPARHCYCDGLLQDTTSPTLRELVPLPQSSDDRPGGSFGVRRDSLVYLPRYLTQDDPFWQRSDAEVKESFWPRSNGCIRTSGGEVLAFEVSRVREVLAARRFNTRHRSCRRRTSLEHVFIVNSAQIANGTLNLNDDRARQPKAIELSDIGRPTWCSSHFMIDTRPWPAFRSTWTTCGPTSRPTGTLGESAVLSRRHLPSCSTLLMSSDCGSPSLRGSGRGAAW
jgi:hypothetical protein